MGSCCSLAAHGRRSAYFAQFYQRQSTYFGTRDCVLQRWKRWYCFDPTSTALRAINLEKKHVNRCIAVNRRMSKQKDTSVYFPTLVFEGKVRRPAVVLPSSQSRISSSLNIEPAKCINTSHLSVGHINHRLLLTEAPSSCTHSRRKDQTSSTNCKLMVQDALPAVMSIGASCRMQQLTINGRNSTSCNFKQAARD